MLKKKTRILLFVKLPPPITGATLLNNYVAESALLNEAYDFTIIPISYKSQLAAAKLVSLKKSIIILKLLFKLTYSIIRCKPSMVYFQVSPLGLAFFRDCLFIIVIKLFKRNIIFHLHGKGIKKYIENSRIKKLIYKWAFNNSSVICLSERLIFDIKDFYSATPYIVNNGIPLLKKTTIVERNNFDQSTRILFFSNLIISKGIFDYLDAVDLLVKKSIPVKCYIVGDEAELTSVQLQNEIKVRNLITIVSYLGAKYDDDKYATYNQSDILVYPSFNDAWGIVILEAMQSGLPVIATREGSIPEIVDDGVTGFIVDKHSPDQLAEKIEILINNPDLRKSMGEAGRKKFLEKYTLEIFEQNMHNVFRSVLEKTPSQAII